MVVNINSEVDLLSRWLVGVVGLILRLGFLVKNNTGKFTIGVVAGQVDGNGVLSG